MQKWTTSKEVEENKNTEKWLSLADKIPEIWVTPRILLSLNSTSCPVHHSHFTILFDGMWP
jgi:hypothetical protein